MNAPENKAQQGAVLVPPLLNLKQIKKLTDSAMHLFSVLYDGEQKAKQTAKTRLAEEFAKLDLFGLTANKVNAEAEEYRAGSDDSDWYE
jgi:hypothetical protein